MFVERVITIVIARFFIGKYIFERTVGSCLNEVAIRLFRFVYDSGCLQAKRCYSDTARDTAVNKEDKSTARVFMPYGLFP